MRRLVVVLAAVGLILVAACGQAPPAAPTATTAPAPKPTAAPAPPTAAPAAPTPAAAPTAAPGAVSKPTGAAATFNEQAVADFSRGKTIRYIIGFGPGGGYDTYARLV